MQRQPYFTRCYFNTGNLRQNSELIPALMAGHHGRPALPVHRSLLLLDGDGAAGAPPPHIRHQTDNLRPGGQGGLQQHPSLGLAGLHLRSYKDVAACPPRSPSTARPARVSRRRG